MTRAGAPAGSLSSPQRGFFFAALGSIAFYAAPMAVRFAASMAVIPVYTRLLTPADYGVLELLDLTSFLIAALIGSNFGLAVFYYYAAGRDDRERGAVISTAYLGSYILSALPAALGWAAPGFLSQFVFGTRDYALHVRIVLSTVALSFPAEVGLCVLRAMDRARTYMILSVCRILLGLLLSILLLVQFQAGVLALLWSSLAVTAMSALLAGWMCLPFLRHALQLPLFLKQLRYSWPLSVSALASLILDFGDRYVLQRNVSMADLGIYGLAYKFGMIVAFASLVFNQYWKPKMFSVVQSPGGDALYVRVFTYYLLALTSLVIGLTMFGLPLLHIAVGKDFLGAVDLIPWLAVLYLIRAAGDFFRNAFYLERATAREAQVTWLGAVVCLAGYFLLIPSWKLWGAILATGISFIFMFAAGHRMAQTMRPFPFEYRRLLLAAGAGLALILVRMSLNPANPGVQLALGLALALLFPALLWKAGWFEQHEKELLAEALQKARRRLSRV